MLNETGMYGHATIDNAIFEGKHIKRGMEANMIIYLRQEMSNKANQLSTDINSMDLDSANNHLNTTEA